MIGDDINDTVVRTAAAPKGAVSPDKELRSDSVPEPVQDIALEAAIPRDIAREPPKEARPLRDIARGDMTVKEPARDPELEALRERLRDPLRGDREPPARDPLREMLRDAASREPPRQPPAAPTPQANNPVPPVVAAPAQTVTVRNPGFALLAILILVLGVVGAGLLGWQLNLLQGQMNDLRATVTQNGKVADAASRLSDAATQANEIANQSLANSTRPWVGVDTVEAGAIQAGQSLNIEVRVRNSGRTPSTDVQGLFLVYISPIDNPPALLTDQCASCVRSVMLPNGTASYKLSVRDAVMTPDEVQRIKDGKDTMWIVGRLDYHDGEGEFHTTRSCLYYRTGVIAAFTACSDGNAAN